ncbi:MAG: class I SAM-dependent methyltransferase [Candidatus Marsarchaeota archaeon]|nr:class I SAM-dependent methyltransferase [Candidatus Marsarchaeota archaeon]
MFDKLRTDSTFFKGVLLTRMFTSALEQNTVNILDLAKESVHGVQSPAGCDLGCGDGALTERVAQWLGGIPFYGVEIHEPNVAAAKRRGLRIIEQDLNGHLDLPSDAFDLVLANQVIEHLYDTDSFLHEVFRIVKPGGSAIISTENLASWHNLLALFLGWQAFSLTNVSGIKSGIGNPLAIHSGQDGNVFPMQHHRIFTLRALQELLVLHGFRNIKSRGAGYYPLSSKFGLIDPKHAHFITVRGEKPKV